MAFAVWAATVTVCVIEAASWEATATWAVEEANFEFEKNENPPDEWAPVSSAYINPFSTIYSVDSSIIFFLSFFSF